MKHLFGLALSFAFLSSTGCRTQLAASRKPPRSEKYVEGQGCDILDYSVASDLPGNASDLGAVSVRQEEGESDESTFLRLRKEICKLGGNALSNPAWVHGEGESEPRILRANAWFVP